MNALLLIDALAALFALIGFHLAFRQKVIRQWVAARRGQQPARGGAAANNDGMDSVLRMVGVMVMAFSITGCAFANLIAHYAGGSVN